MITLKVILVVMSRCLCVYCGEEVTEVDANVWECEQHGVLTGNEVECPDRKWEEQEI